MHVKPARRMISGKWVGVHWSYYSISVRFKSEVAANPSVCVVIEMWTWLIIVLLRNPSTLSLRSQNNGEIVSFRIFWQRSGFNSGQKVLSVCVCLAEYIPNS